MGKQDEPFRTTLSRTAISHELLDRLPRTWRLLVRSAKPVLLFSRPLALLLSRARRELFRPAILAISWESTDAFADLGPLAAEFRHGSAQLLIRRLRPRASTTTRIVHPSNVVVDGENRTSTHLHRQGDPKVGVGGRKRLLVVALSRAEDELGHLILRELMSVAELFQRVLESFGLRRRELALAVGRV